jgi:Zn-dependent membrane protease YugP
MQLSTFAHYGQKLGIVIITVLPALSAVSISPRLAIVCVAIGFLAMAVQVIADLVTLPVEYDASFKKALPILEHGGYLDRDDMPGARKILTACAFTYLAGSMASMVNIFRWLQILRGAV